jgi:general stress protein YciG
MTQIEKPNDQTSDDTKTDIQEITPATKPKSNRGFASMDPDRQREIASKGGHASGGNFANNRERAAEAGRKGGQLSGGNFANNRQRAVEAGRKGGQHSSGNFANNRERAANAGRKGGQASSGQRQQVFQPQQTVETASTRSDELRRQ